MVSGGQAQHSCKVRIHLRMEEQPKKTFIFVNTLFLRIVEKQFIPLTLMRLFPFSHRFSDNSCSHRRRAE